METYSDNPLTWIRCGYFSSLRLHAKRGKMFRFRCTPVLWRRSELSLFCWIGKNKEARYSFLGLPGLPTQRERQLYFRVPVVYMYFSICVSLSVFQPLSVSGEDSSLLYAVPIVSHYFHFSGTEGPSQMTPSMCCFPPHRHFLLPIDLSAPTFYSMNLLVGRSESSSAGARRVL